MAEGGKAATMLAISGPGESRRQALDARGALVGRDTDCDVVIESERVSRRHARLFQDPFARWVVEDLGSRNGVWVGGRRVQAHALLPGEKIAIGPFTLEIAERIDRQIAPDPSVLASGTLVEDSGTTEIVSSRAAAPETVSSITMGRLNRLIARFSSITSASELYSEACRCLAEETRGVGVVLRLPSAKEPLPASPLILAFSPPGGPGRLAPGGHSTLTFSRRVLDAVRTKGSAVMASNTALSPAQMDLTVQGEDRSRAVISAPVTEMSGSMDVLYLEMPAEAVGRDTFDFVQVAARQVSFARKNLLLSEIKAERQVIDQQLSLAREIQAGLAPQNLDQFPGIEVAAFYRPAFWVGGDYCDLWKVPDGRVAFVVGDVSGKGLPAAMAMANIQAVLRTMLSFCTTPSEVAERLDRHIAKHLPGSMFVTLLLGLYDLANGRLEYVNAGHIPPMLVAPGSCTSLGFESSDRPLGVIEGSFHAQNADVAPGASVLVVTDGVTESMSPSGELFGMERLEALLAKDALAPAERVKSVAKAAEDFAQNLPQHDDLTVFALRRMG